MSAPGGSLFLAFALYCSHTANTEVSNNTAYGIRNAGSCSACYWPLKSNLGTAIKAETPLPLTLLLHCCWPGNTRALTDHRAFLPDTNRTVFSKGATDLCLWKLSVASSSSLRPHVHRCTCSSWLICKGFVRSMAKLNSRVRLGFNIFQQIWVCVRRERQIIRRISALPFVFPLYQPGSWAS